MTGYGLNPVKAHFYKYDNKAHTKAEINKLSKLRANNIAAKTKFYAKKATKKIKQQNENISFLFHLFLIFVAVITFLYLFRLIIK